MRSRKIATRGRVTKGEFVQKCGLDRRTARNVWEKGAFIGEYVR